MDNQNNIQDELKGLNSGLPVANGQGPFSVPDGYFDGLAAQILARAKAPEQAAAEELQSLSPLLASLPKGLPYTVPEGYFDENLIALPSLFKEEEPALLKGIGKELPYTVPAGYFDQLPQQVLTNLPRPKAKVVPFFSRTWTKAAVAAAISGIVLFGGYRLLNDPDETMPAIAAQQPADTTRNLVAKNGTGTAQELRNVSPEEVEEFMKSVPYNTAKARNVVLPSEEKKELREMLKDVSQQEIDAFLEALPTSDENLLLID